MTTGVEEAAVSDATVIRMPVLPVEAYFDPDWFAREQTEIFGRAWQFAGFVEDVAGPGDYVTVSCGPSNLFVVRGEDGTLRAFHNMCRHRGARLLRTVGRGRKSIACPYHDWTYDLDGRLVGVPDERREFPGLDKRLLCLHAASVGVWRGLVFVHPEARPGTDLLTFLGEVDDFMPHHPDRLVEYDGARATHEIAANWKIVAENYIDGYHLARLHAGTLSMYDHARQETRFAGPHFLFYEPHAPDYAAALPSAAPAPMIEHVAGARPGAYVPLLFPNLGLIGSESTFSVFVIEPVSPTRTRVHLRSKAESASLATWALQTVSSWYRSLSTYGPKDPSFPADHPLGSADFIAEDILVCEAQQQNLRAPLFSVGATALHHESGVRGLQRVIAEWLGEPVPEPAARRDEPTIEPRADVAATLTVRGLGAETTIDVHPDETVLEAMQRAGLDPPSQCEVGLCGTCMTTLEEGTVEMETTAALDGDARAAGCILACQATPTSPRLVVRYDESDGW